MIESTQPRHSLRLWFFFIRLKNANYGRFPSSGWMLGNNPNRFYATKVWRTTKPTCQHCASRNEKRLRPEKKGRIVNDPFESGSLFNAIKGKKFLEWAAENDIQSWGQYFLKYSVAKAAVNCVISSTSHPKHVVDNMGEAIAR